MTDAPGRTCRISYRTTARGLRQRPLVNADTVRLNWLQRTEIPGSAAC